MTRKEAAHQFLVTHGWGDARVTPLAGDASHRRYDRLQHPDGRTAVLMDAPPEKGEDVRPFITIGRWLTARGLSAPHIYAEDSGQGFLLIEDLGDRLFASVMARDPALQTPFYTVAVDVLIHAQNAMPPDLPAYDAATSVPLAALAFDWYQAGALGRTNTAQKADFVEAFTPIIADFDDALTVLIQRDFHAENLLWLPDRDGVARVGLLDFQDAMLGHRAYDLVSIVQDARRDVPGDIAAAMIQRFIDKSGVEAERFQAAYAVFGLQRNLRILGVFARLCLRDGKAHYVDLIPRVWRHIETNLNTPAMAGLQSLLSTALPAPEPSLLNELKQKSGLWVGR